MKKTLLKTLLVAGLTLSTAIPAFAATWYSSNITLPRTGSMTTVTRAATASSQYTKVTDNAYDVNGRIVTSSGTVLSTYVTHQDSQNSAYGTVYTHKTGTSVGDNIKAEFKTSAVNYFTTTAKISWSP